jgi:hypothetical protein
MAETTTMPAHVALLADEQWGVWRWVGLRGAGFPANNVLKLADPDCARSADALIDAEAHVERMHSQALAVVNAALDELRAGQGWDDPQRRKPLLTILRNMKKGQAPQPSSAPAALTLALTELQSAHAQAVAAREQFAHAFEAATQTTSQAIIGIARNDRFHEALLWQNRRAFHTAVRPLLATAPGAARDSQQRQHEELVASYLQRYCVKNDTIGFFGPVGWAKFVPHDDAISVRPGPALLRTRSVYFEQWTIDALTETLAKTKVLLPWCAPRRLPFFDLCGTMLHWPLKRPMQVSPGQAAVLAACTGERTARAIAAALCQSHPLEFGSELAVYKLLNQLNALGLIVWTIEVPFASHPERALRRLLEGIGEERLRRPALDALDELNRLRADVARAAGGAEQLDQALGALETAFTRLTGAEATRRAGATYAARTLVYEDCRRDVEVELGPALLDELGPPLALLLTSARWFTYQTAAIYRAAFDEMYTDLVRQTGSAQVELVVFWQQVQARLHSDQPRLTNAVKQMFQERWAQVLDTTEGQHQHSYTSSELWPRVAAAFAAPWPGWQSARYHSPDIMIAAASPEAIRQDQYQLVMGELHLGGNTLRGTLFVGQHPAPAELFAAIEHDLPAPQVVPVIPRNWPEITARTRSELVTAKDFRLAFTYDACGTTPSRLLSIGSLVIEKTNGELVIRSRDGHQQFDVVEFFAEILIIDVVDGFKLFDTRGHTPRVAIDRLVVARESWQFAPESLPFVRDKSETSRFLAARRWARTQGLPRCVFIKVPIERKPFYVDFDSPILVNMLAKTGRRMLEQGAADSLITVTEMLPTIDQSWLHDADGQRYTSELRIVAVDQTCPPQRHQR